MGGYNPVLRCDSEPLKVPHPKPLKGVQEYMVCREVPT